MHPILFEYGPIRIGSYGVLLALAFLSAIFFTNREFRKNAADPALAWDIYLLAIIGGLVGSRLLFILELPDQFLKAPIETLFGSTGFSVIGGYLLAFLLSWLRVRASGEPFFRIADLTAPGMAVGYAVGRLGCIAAGDGCYGIPTLSGCAMHFPNGLVSTLSAKNPLLSRLFTELFPGTPVPVDIGVHPTPLYESISHIILLAILLLPGWKIGPGRRLAFFLCWFGTSRFLVEFIRLNPPSWLGLTSDHWLSILIVAIGMGLFLRPQPIPEPKPSA
ncbi:MAG TPA: prolipoprotein diacylglyceryl transferase family protein [Candidatus Ozemobacteraceae bacterium]